MPTLRRRCDSWWERCGLSLSALYHWMHACFPHICPTGSPSMRSGRRRKIWRNDDSNKCGMDSCWKNREMQDRRQPPAWLSEVSRIGPILISRRVIFGSAGTPCASRPISCWAFRTTEVLESGPGSTRAWVGDYLHPCNGGVRAKISRYTTSGLTAEIAANVEHDVTLMAQTWIDCGLLLEG